jgi:hypothetical protein
MTTIREVVHWRDHGVDEHLKSRYWTRSQRGQSSGVNGRGRESRKGTYRGMGYKPFAVICSTRWIGRRRLPIRVTSADQHIGTTKSFEHSSSIRSLSPRLQATGTFSTDPASTDGVFLHRHPTPPHSSGLVEREGNGETSGEAWRTADELKGMGRYGWTRDISGKIQTRSRLGRRTTRQIEIVSHIAGVRSASRNDVTTPPRNR